MASDIIVIAAYEGKELPQSVKEWMLRWLLMKGDRPSALVATLDYTLINMKTEQAVLPYLSKLASCGKMQFFANSDANNAQINLGRVREDNWNCNAALARTDLLE